jgi:hypothetical protein
MVGGTRDNFNFLGALELAFYEKEAHARSKLADFFESLNLYPIRPEIPGSGLKI